MKKVAGLRAKLTKTTIDKITPPSTGKIIVWDGLARKEWRAFLGA